MTAADGLESGACDLIVGAVVACVEDVASETLLEACCPCVEASFNPSLAGVGESFWGTVFLKVNFRFGAAAVRVSCSLSLKFLIA